MSPDVFLSRQNPPVRYDGSHFQGTPAEIVAALISLNATRSWSPETATFVYDQHETEDFIPGPVTAATTSPMMVTRERVAMEAVHAAEKTGNLPSIWTAIDHLNDVRMAKGGGVAYVAAPDFDLLAFQHTPTGEIARQIKADRAILSATTFATGEEPPLEMKQRAWFDTKDSFDSLNAYAVK